MRYCLNILFLFCFLSCFSQTDFDKTPENAKEIHFVYEKKSNFYFDQNGFYADTMLYKIEFPNLKYLLKNHPKEEYVCGFVSFDKLNFEEKGKMKAIIYHANEKFVGIYNIKRNRTEIKVTRSDESARKLFETILKSSYSSFYYDITLDYNLKTKFINYPLVDYNFDFVKEQITVKYKTNVLGSYTEERKNLLLTNIVNFDPEISKYITPGVVITNNDFGVKKLTTMYETYELKSVTYK